jgi:hypothetical protein
MPAIRATHGFTPAHAVAVTRGLAYHPGMNTKHFPQHGSQPAIARADRLTSGFLEPHVVTKKALERWENEGGGIPELGSANEPDPSASATHA